MTEFWLMQSMLRRFYSAQRFILEIGQAATTVGADYGVWFD